MKIGKTIEDAAIQGSYKSAVIGVYNTLGALPPEAFEMLRDATYEKKELSPKMLGIRSALSRLMLIERTFWLGWRRTELGNRVLLGESSNG